MQRKAYVPGAAVLLAALLAACTGGSGSDSPPDDPKPGDAGPSATAAQPGKYRTLSDACGALSQGTLDSLLPGIKQLTDQEQRDQAYEGDATLTYDNDRRSGCRWKAESTDTTDHLLLDFERVVSYDNAVSDDTRAQKVFAAKQTDANLPEPSTSGSGPEGSDGSAGSESPTSASPSGSASPTPSGDSSGSAGPGGASPSGSATATAGATATGTPADLQPRTLDDLGDAAFLNDVLSTARQRTVTVVFRTSNVVVSIEYDEQPTHPGTVPDSKEMQDRARKLAQQLADSFAG
ncbi:DUF3558 domain-containing protein [Streptomyces avermitilis]|uniref:DUF3558 domain-containing protein n=1 Tax=Streptomyces avermitilis TaxID=33903 RepID=UPI0033FE85DF